MLFARVFRDTRLPQFNVEEQDFSPASTSNLLHLLRFGNRLQLSPKLQILAFLQNKNYTSPFSSLGKEHLKLINFLIEIRRLGQSLLKARSKLLAAGSEEGSGRFEGFERVFGRRSASRKTGDRYLRTFD